MQQPGQFSFGGEAERDGELFRQVGDVAKMFRQRLPPVFTSISKPGLRRAAWGTVRHLTLTLSPFEAERDPSAVCA